jgi:hypothetical protein
MTVKISPKVVGGKSQLMQMHLFQSFLAQKKVVMSLGIFFIAVIPAHSASHNNLANIY